MDVRSASEEPAPSSFLASLAPLRSFSPLVRTRDPRAVPLHLRNIENPCISRGMSRVAEEPHPIAYSEATAGVAFEKIVAPEDLGGVGGRGRVLSPV